MNVPLIDLRGIDKTYSTEEVEVRAVRGVDLSIARGEFVAVMGSSGSGKSTLMNILGCLDRPTAGDYLLNGEPVSKMNRSELSILRNAKIGFVFQSFNLLARTSAIENVELPLFYSQPLVARAQRRRRALDALEKVGLRERAGHHPSQLSGGQQQRIAIARALVNSPELVLADEPTGNLDTRTSAEIMGLFEALNDSGITIMMVTHELDIAGYCKRIIVMRDGRIISDQPNETRRHAALEIARIESEEREAKLS
jgi:putative ABC transport system ATP-binding protein